MSLLILLSPSKTQELGSRTGIHSLPRFQEEVQQLITILQTYSVADLMQLMDVSEKIAVLNRQRFAAFSFPAERKHCREALLAFRGDVFSQMKADQYTQSTLQFAQKHLCILSGLYGVLQPLDLIQPYRLEMGGKFQPQQGQNLYAFWKKKITDAVNETLNGLPEPALVNLASGEYFKVIDRGRLAAPVLQVYFQQEREGKFRTIAIHAKKARGALADSILTRQLNNAKDLQDFSFNGYEFDRQRSNSSELFFTKRS